MDRVAPPAEHVDAIPGAWRSRGEVGLVSSLQKINKLMLGQDLDPSQFSSSESDAEYPIGAAPELWRRTRYASGAGREAKPAFVTFTSQSRRIKSGRRSGKPSALNQRRFGSWGAEGRKLETGGGAAQASTLASASAQARRVASAGGMAPRRTTPSIRAAAHAAAAARESIAVATDIELGGLLLASERLEDGAVGTGTRTAALRVGADAQSAQDRGCAGAFTRVVASADARAARTQRAAVAEARAVAGGAEARAAVASGGRAGSALLPVERAGGAASNAAGIHGRGGVVWLSHDDTARRASARVLRAASDGAVLCARAAKRAARSAADAAERSCALAAQRADADRAAAVTAAELAFAVAAAAAACAAAACRSTDKVVAWCLPVASPGKDARSSTAAALGGSAAARGGASAVLLRRPAWCCPSCTFANPPSDALSAGERAVCAVCSRSADVAVDNGVVPVHNELIGDTAPVGEGGGGPVCARKAARPPSAAASRGKAAEAAKERLAERSDDVRAAAEATRARAEAAAAAFAADGAAVSALGAAMAAARDAEDAEALAASAAAGEATAAANAAAAEREQFAEAMACATQGLWRGRAERRTARAQLGALRAARAECKSARQRDNAARALQRSWRDAARRMDEAVEQRTDEAIGLAVDDAIAAASVELAGELTRALRAAAASVSPAAALADAAAAATAPEAAATVATPLRQTAAAAMRGSGVAAARSLRIAREQDRSAMSAALDAVALSVAAGCLLAPPKVALSPPQLVAEPVAAAPLRGALLFSAQCTPQPPPPKVIALRVVPPAAVVRQRVKKKRFCMNCGSHEKKGWYCKTCGRKLELRACAP